MLPFEVCHFGLSIKDRCTLRKFPRLHFRRKSYTVPITGVFPVTGQESGLPHVLDSSSESDDEWDLHEPMTAPLPADTGLEIAGGEVTSGDDCDDDDDAGRAVMDEDDDDDGRRPHRTRKEPVRFGDAVVGEAYERDMGNI